MKEKANRNDNTYHEIATDSLLNYETVKYFTNEAYEINKYVTSVAKYQEYNLKIMFSLNGLNATQQLIMQFTLAGVMIVAAHQVSEGTITLGDWVAIYSWVLTIFVPLNFLGTGPRHSPPLITTPACNSGGGGGDDDNDDAMSSQVTNDILPSFD